MSIGDIACAIAPSGRQFRLRFDGYQDFQPVRPGLQEQFTAQEDIPGLVPSGGTTYACTILKRGFHITTPQTKGPNQ